MTEAETAQVIKEDLREKNLGLRTTSWRKAVHSGCLAYFVRKRKMSISLKTFILESTETLVSNISFVLFISLALSGT